MEKAKYEFLARAYQCASSEDACGWVFVSLPQELSAEIRESFKHLEEGWGRMKVTAQLGGSEWQTSVWFDTKQNAYLLPLKAKVRRQENVVLDEELKLTILV